MCKVQEPPPAHHGRTRKRKRPIIRTVKPIQPILCILSMEHNRRLYYSCISHLRRKLNYGKCRVEIIADS